MGKRETLPTIWEVPDELWERIHPAILEIGLAKSTARRRVDRARILDGIFIRMRICCQPTVCPGNWDMTAPFTKPSSAGRRKEYWNTYGRC